MFNNLESSISFDINADKVPTQKPNNYIGRACLELFNKHVALAGKQQLSNIGWQFVLSVYDSSQATSLKIQGQEK